MATDFAAVFTQLRGLLSSLESNLIVKADSLIGYSLDTPYSEEYKKSLFFAAVNINKNYVSYHLMPVYMFPELLKGISLALKNECRAIMF